MKGNKFSMARSLLFVILLCVSLMGGLATIFGFLGSLYWIFDLLSHFREYYLLLFLFVIFISTWKKFYILLYVGMVLVMVNLISWLPFYLPSVNKNSSINSQLTIFTANVKTDNRQYDLLVKYVQEINPDVVVLVEVDAQWIAATQVLRQKYQYSVSAPQEDNFGVLLMSKYPLQNGEIVNFGMIGRSSAIATVLIDNKKITIIGTHPVPPFNKRLSHLRDRHLLEIGDLIDRQTLPTVLVGDLNTTPFSHMYRLLVDKHKLTNCFQGFGLARTWQFNPLMPPIPLSIDHCLHTDGISVATSYVGEYVGSDHRPIINTIYTE